MTSLEKESGHPITVQDAAGAVSRLFAESMPGFAAATVADE
jgi:hypothetical protein